MTKEGLSGLYSEGPDLPVHSTTFVYYKSLKTLDCIHKHWYSIGPDQTAWMFIVGHVHSGLGLVCLLLNGLCHGIMSSGICRQWRPRSACTSAQSDQSLCCLQVESLDTTRMFNGEQMPSRDFAHVQDDVNSHILCMLEGTFSLQMAQIVFCRIYYNLASVNDLKAWRRAVCHTTPWIWTKFVQPAALAYHVVNLYQNNSL